MSDALEKVGDAIETVVLFVGRCIIIAVLIAGGVYWYATPPIAEAV